MPGSECGLSIGAQHHELVARKPVLDDNNASCLNLFLGAVQLHIFWPVNASSYSCCNGLRPPSLLRACILRHQRQPAAWWLEAVAARVPPK